MNEEGNERLYMLLRYTFVLKGIRYFTLSIISCEQWPSSVAPCLSSRETKFN